jgi:hypothetical protein
MFSGRPYNMEMVWPMRIEQGWKANSLYAL